MLAYFKYIETHVVCPRKLFKTENKLFSFLVLEKQCQFCYKKSLILTYKTAILTINCYSKAYKNCTD